MAENLTNMNLSRSNRVTSIDIVRGAIMLIMAIDHVRDFTHTGAMTYNPTDLSTASPYLFLTRWITHFCAPVFVFLSGMSAYISGQRRTKAELSAFLIKRGLWLVLVELAVISFGLTFSPFYNVLILQVIWAIGWSMVLLGVLVRGSYTLVVLAGILLFFGHNVADYLVVSSVTSKGLPSLWTEHLSAVLWKTFVDTPGSFYSLGHDHFVLIAYSILPWAGLLFLGYAFGKMYRNGVSSAERSRSALVLGLILTGLFVLLRFVNQYGDPAPWSVQPGVGNDAEGGSHFSVLYTIFSFVNVTKYPPSLMYACMTLGPALVCLSLFERTRNRFTDFLTVYGKVPFFYYVCHFFLAHLACMILFYAQGFPSSSIVDQRTLFWFRPVELGVSLPYVYLIWLAVILTLYCPCKWFGKYKQAHSQWWLSYL